MFFVIYLNLVTIGNAQVQLSGSLSTHIIDFVGSASFPGVETNAYQHPTPAQRIDWENTITALLNGNYSSAHLTAGSFGYRVVQFYDETTLQTYYMLEKTTAGTNHWGTFVLNPAATRAKIFIQAPHPKYDSNTGTQGTYIFRYQNCRALFVSGTHRCNSTTNTDCSGTTTVCGDSGPYKISDQPHTVNGTLQITTEVLLNSINNLIVIQPHGFSKGENDPHIIMSNGTRQTPTPDYVAMIRDNLLSVDDTLTFKIPHFDLSWNELIGFTNTQGRLINNSINPCSNNASTATGRFIHIEQAFSLRNSTETRKKLSDAIGLTFPEYSTLTSGNWNAADNWMSEALPDSNQNVKIMDGHSITISGEVSCKSILFGNNNSKLILEPGAILNVYGDFQLATITHNAFPSWGTGAKIVFKGNSATQIIKNLFRETSTFSSSFINLVVDKVSGKVTTEDSVRVNIGNSLEIINGTFELGNRADIEGRDLTGVTSTTPTITVRSGGVFDMKGSLSHIRSGTSGTNPIGKMTVFGTAILRSTSSLGIAIGNIDIKSGGLLQLQSFSNTYPNVIKTGSITIETGGIVEINSSVNLYHSTSSVLLNSEGTYRVNVNPDNVDFSFPQTFTNSGTIEYSRNGEQKIKTMLYNNLTISGSGSKTISSDLIVNGVLTVSGGNLSTGDYKVSLGDYASLVESAGNTINGKISIARTISHNVSQSFGGIGINITAVGGNPGITSIDRITGIASTGAGNYSIKRYFDIVPTNNTNLNASLVFRYDETELNGVAETSLALFKSTDDGTNWFNEYGTVDIDANTITRTGINSFSRWTAASLDQPLPVEVSTFYIKNNKNTITLFWETETELDLSHFEIERLASRIDSQRNWEKVAEIKSMGNSSSIKNYSFEDKGLNTGKYAYRLKMIENSGNVKYSGEIETEIASPSGYELYQNFPNPFNPTTTISFTVPNNSWISLDIFSITGERIETIVDRFYESGYYHISYNGSKLSSGFYICRLTGENYTKSIKLTIMK